MRKLKLFSVLMCLFIGIGQVWAGEVEYTMSTSGSASATIEANWTANSNATFNGSGAYWGCASNNNQFVITSGSGITGTVTKVQVTGKRNKAKSYTIDVTVGGYPLGSQFQGSGAASGTSQNYNTNNTFSNSTGLTGTIVITVNAAGGSATADKGSFWITSITVTTADGGSSNPTISVSPAELDFETIGVGDAAPAAQEFTITGSNLTSALTVTSSNTSLYTVAVKSGSSLNPSTGSVSATIVVTPQAAINGSAGTKSATITIAGGGLAQADQKTVTVSTEVKAKHTVTWNNNGVTSTTQVLDGEKPVFPATPASCDLVNSKVFVGWATSSWTGKLANLNEKTVYTTADAMPAVTSAGVEYYAVFAKGVYTEIASSNLATGQIVLIVNPDAKMALKSVKTDNLWKGESVTIDGTSITSNAANIQWVVEKTNDTYKFKALNTLTDSYIKALTSGDYIGLDATGSSWTISDSNPYLIKESTSTRYLEYYNSKFTSYAQSSAPSSVAYKMKFYVLENPDFITTCCTEHNVNIASLTNGSVEANPTSACEDTEITLTIAPSTGYELSTLTVGGNDVTASVSNDEYTFDMPDADVAVSATFAAKSHNVIFHKNDGGTDVTTTQAFTYDADAVNLKAIATIAWTRDNYAFTGWNTDPTGVSGTAYADEASFTLSVDADVDLYAQWIENTAHAVAYSGDAQLNYTLKPASVADGEDLTVTYSIAEGYELKSVVVTMGGADLTVDVDFTADETGVLVAPTGGVTEDVEITFTIEEIKYTVTFNAGSGTCTTTELTQSSYGEEIELPTPTISAGVWSFAGWTTANVEQEANSVSPLLTGNYQPDQSRTLYAVYRRTVSQAASTWGLISAVNNVTAGTYVITWDNSLYLPNTAANSNPVVGTGITEAENALTNTVTDAMKWTFTGNNTDGFTVSSGSNYLNSTNAAQGISVTTTNSTTWKASVNATYGMLLRGSDGGIRNLAVFTPTGTGNKTWRYYTAGSDYKGTLRLYKETPGATTYGYLTSPEVTAYEITTSVEHGTVTPSVTSAAAGATITLENTPDAGYKFLAYSVYKTGEPATTVEVSNGQFTMPAYAVTVSADFRFIGTEANPLTVAQAKTLIDDFGGADIENAYVSGIISQVDEISPKPSGYGNATYWISDDGTTTSQQFEAFRGKDMNDTDFDSEDDLVEGDVVTITGTIKLFGSEPNQVYEFAQGNYLVSYTHPKVLQSIALSGTTYKTAYTTSDLALDPIGLVITASYNTPYENATIATDNANVTYTGYDLSVANAQKVTVTYTEGGVSKSAQYDITVEAACSSDKITITKGTETNGTFTLSIAGKQCLDEGNISTVVTPTPSTHYHVKAVTVTTEGTYSVSDPDGEGKYTVSNLSADAVINVEFEEDAYANVTFVGGAGTTGEAPALQKKYVGEAVTMPGKNTLAKSGNSFAGWTLNGTDVVTEYTIVAADAAIGGKTLTVTAKWSAYPWAVAGKWELVTDASELTVDPAIYVILADTLASGNKACAGQDNANYRSVVNVDISEGILTWEGNDPAVFTLETGNVTGTVAIVDAVNGGYLNANGTGNNNYLSTTASKESDNASWEIKAVRSNGGATVQAKSNNRNLLNVNGDRCGAYNATNPMKGLAFYKFVEGAYYNITYAKGEVDAANNMPTTQTTDNHGEATLSDLVPTAVGYTFANWSDGVTTYNPGADVSLTADLALTAQWTAAPKQTLTYNINGGTITEGTVPGATEYDLSEEVTVTNAVLTKGDLLFAGWEDGEGNIHAKGSTFTMPANDVTLTAKFVNGAIYTIASTESVTAQGAPEGTNATFSNDYTANKEQLVADKTMVLTLTGYDLYTIKGITLKMHANSGQGKGTFSVKVGSTTIAEIADATSFNSWYDNTTFGTTYRDVHVDLTPTRVGVGEDVVITIAATQNSLYCQTFTIEYELALDDIRTAGVTPGVMGTICPKKEVKYPAGASFFEISYVEYHSGVPYKVFYDEIAEGASLEAGHPYLFQADEESTAIKGIAVGDDATSAINDHGFKGVLENETISVVTADVENYRYYIVYNNEIRLCGEGQFLIRAERAYLDMSDPEVEKQYKAPINGRRRVALTNNAPQVATGMDELNASEAPVKLMIDGKFYILRGEKMYDATGKLVK